MAFFERNRGQIFLIDAIISFSILIFSAGLIFSYYSEKIEDDSLFEYSLEVLNVITNTPINDLNNDEIKQLFVNGEITNIENTIAQQIIIFHVEGKDAYVESILSFIFELYEKKGVGINVSLEDVSTNQVSELFYKDGKISKNNAKIRYRLTRDVIAIGEDFNKYGPYTFIIETWK